MTKTIIGNLKMNLSKTDIKEYVKELREINDENFIIAPAFIYLTEFLPKAVSAQNCYYYDEGAFTGEISPKQLKSIGVNYVIIGHSERRQHFGETDEIINQKIKAALQNDLKIIFCIGDTLLQYEQKQTNKIIENQLRLGLENINNLDNIMIAYEPVWAIGSGKTPTNSEIELFLEHIKKTLSKKSSKIKVLYGGSVNLNNIKHLNQISNCDGFLVGGASKSVIELKKIYWETR